MSVLTKGPPGPAVPGTGPVPETGPVHETGAYPVEWHPSPESRTVLVAGATGRQGGVVVRHLLRAGWIPRGLTRDSSSAASRELILGGVEMVKGDMRDVSTLEAAMEGVHGVFSVQESRRMGFHEEIRQGMNMADAALRSGVRHFVYASMASADRWPKIDRLEAKYTVENHLRWIGLARTILRPALFMEDHIGPDPMKWIRQKRFFSPLPPDRKIQLASVEDLGAFTVAAFLHPDRFLGKSIGFAGEEVTNAEIARALSEVSGRKVRVRRLPRPLSRFTLGRNLDQIYRKLARSGFGLDLESIATAFPDVPVTGLSGWLRARLGPMV